MITITTEQVKLIDQIYFYKKLEQFIITQSSNEKLLSLVSDGEKLHSLWSANWKSASKRSEHDCALFLVLLAVCECEGVALESIDKLLDHIVDHEVKMKQFISERGYFRFSDFDFVSVIEDGGPNA